MTVIPGDRITCGVCGTRLTNKGRFVMPEVARSAAGGNYCRGLGAQPPAGSRGGAPGGGLGGRSPPEAGVWGAAPSGVQGRSPWSGAKPPGKFWQMRLHFDGQKRFQRASHTRFKHTPAS